MNSLAHLSEPAGDALLPVDRPGLLRFLLNLSGQLSADNYLIARIGSERGNDEVKIVAANWTFDSVETLGHENLLALVGAPETSFVGAAVRNWRPVSIPALPPRVAAQLEGAGHREFVSTRLRVGNRHYLTLFSANRLDRLDLAQLPAALMALSYALSSTGDGLDETATDYPISDRERECLGWVAEGKTTMDIATILDVSSNTINSYLTHAIRKLSARNRTMAVALAIRSGII
ncbi:MAG: helix-turn-helix transcriptional regulator [Rhizobiaceae bacterium]|nr:helix-turn-helix transcriptional regulator [Rhizobiaceae bacterium]